MTVITRGSKIWRVKATENSCQVSEEVKINLPGLEFVEGCFGEGFVRGYVLVPIMYGCGQLKKGSITLKPDDIEEVIYL